MNKIIVLIVFIYIGLSVTGQTILNRGDLAIVGVNSTITPSTQDEISFVCFKDITNGTSIQVTDNGYEACTAGQWSSAEGGATLTRTGGTITAGTVMTFRDSYASGNPIRFTYPDSNWSTADMITDTVMASYVDLNSKGDQIYMAQGGTWTMQSNSSCTVSSTAGGNYTTKDGDFPGIDGRILFGFSTSGGWLPFQFSTGQSGLYPSMSCFTMALAGSAKYNKYTGLLSKATQTEWLSRINTQNNWSTYNTSDEYFNASPDFHSLTIPINANGLVPTPSWTSPKNLLCTNAGNIDFTTLITGTKGGTWSGNGISSDGIFNPSGLSGTYDITYTINYNSGTDICPLTQTDTINVATGATPTFNAIPTLVQGSIAPILPTSSTNSPPITGTWNAPISTKSRGITTYTFTPTVGKCNNIATMEVDVIDSSLSTKSTCLGSTLYLTGVSSAKSIAWYKDGKLDTTIYQSIATTAVTVAGGNGQGASNNQLYWPSSVAVDANSNVYVSDYENDRVMLWAKGATTGKVFAGVTGNNGKTGTNGQIPGYFYNPTGVFLSSTGSLYIADYNHHKVQKYFNATSANPILDSTIVGGNESSDSLKNYEGLANLNTPWGIFVDNDSNLFVADPGNYPYPFFENTRTLGNRIMEWMPNASTGELVAGTHFVEGNGLSQLSYPTGVYVNKKGDIYIADFANFRIMKWAKGATSGTIVADLSKIGTGGVGVNPTDVWVDENTDTLYITASNDIVDINTVVPYFNGSDNFLLKWGENAINGTILSKDLLTPNSVTRGLDGSIYVVDRGNNRVQKWAASIDTSFAPTKTGSYYAVITALDGTVDTSNTLTIAMPTSSTTTDSICAGNSYVFNGKTYSSSGTYTVHLTNSGGCDSAATLILTVKNTSASSTNITICPKQLPYTWNGLTFNGAGTQTTHLTNSVGCDSAATLILTVNASIASTTNLSICPNQLPYTWNGLTFTGAGTQTAHLTNSVGCDSVATLVLTINATSSSTTNLSICPNQLPYVWNGLTFNASGIQTAHLTNGLGCDSTATLNLTVSSNTASTTNDSICAGSSYTFNGKTYTAAGTYTAHLTNSAGCDSTATLVLTIKSNSTSVTKQNICSGNSYTFNGTTYTNPGTYLANLINSMGCDSLATLVLSVNNPSTSTTNESICEGNTYTFNGKTYTTAGTYTTHLTNNVGCDSAATLILTVNQNTTSTTAAAICTGGSYAFNGTNYASSGTYTIHLSNSAGCDSTATLVLTVNSPSTSTTNASICEGSAYTFNGANYTIAGTYMVQLTNSVGCDSTATLVLTIKSPTSSITNASICEGGTYLFNGTSYSTAGTYNASLTNSVGCDSTATLVLTINPPITSTTSASICEGGSYLFNGMSYTTAGTYNAHLTTNAGCDSIATLVLTINPPLSSTTNANICEGGSYLFNGTSYNTAGTYNAHLITNTGCDSTATLVLTVNNPSKSTTNDTICISGSYAFNGSIYDSAGTYTANLTNSVGCDSIATLILTIDSMHIPYPPTGKDVVCKNDTIILADLISGGTWSSTNPTIASVNEAGVVTGLNFGSTPINYTVKLPCGIASSSYTIQVLGVKPESSSINKDATCLDPQGGSIKVVIEGTEEPYQFSFNGNMYDIAYTIPNLAVGIYTVYIYNSANCLVDSLTDIKIKLENDGTCDTLFVPTGFVPTSTNPSGSTKLLKPYGGSNSIQSITFKVFNRYGKVVYESHDLNSGWDGTINGTLQDTGAYVWYLEYTQSNGKPRSARGTSVLLR